MTVEKIIKRLERGSAAKNICGFYRGPRFKCQHPLGDSPLSVTPAPGDPTPSFDFLEQQTCTCRRERLLEKKKKERQGWLEGHEMTSNLSGYQLMLLAHGVWISQGSLRNRAEGNEP